MFRSKNKRNNAVGHQNQAQATGSGRLVNFICLVLVLLAGMGAATQYFAHQFQYHSQLGYGIGKFYMPWSILIWYGKWHGRYEQQFMTAFSIMLMVVAVGMIGLLVWNIVRKNTNKAHESLHGSARWADRKDIEAAGLLAKKGEDSDGVYVGGWVDKKGTLHYLRHSGPEHVLTYAPTRSGKGLGLVLPTLLSWPYSTFITDLKGELWALTAGWRKKYAHNKVIRFEPASAQGSAAWNPLDEIRVGTEYEIGDVQNLATMIVDPDGKGLNSHWDKTAFALLTGVILHALYKARDDGGVATLPSVDRMLSDPEKPVGDLWVEMATYPHADGRPLPVISSAGQDMLDRPEEEAGSVLSTAKSFLALYRDNVVAANVSRSDFKIKDLMNDEDPVSLYIITQPNDKARLRPLVRILINMIIRLSADKMDFENGRPKVHYKHKMLAMLDEFPSLGKLEIMQESLAFIAGYGIKCYLICQDLNQLKSRETGYGPDETITSSCHVQNAYPPNRIETAEHLSKLTGITTVVKEQITTSGKRVSAMLGQVSRTTQEVQRPLLTADECMRMPGPVKDARGLITQAGDMVIYVAGYPAIYGRQTLYFKDPVFEARSKVPPPRHTDRTQKKTANTPSAFDTL
ncbi:conjugal transfer protein TraG [Neisseria gonorrhoeae]|uniref:type IV secretory system conjugative DNA transfer family protein n=2 Tax=Neisseria gonorrhoeae TaxID=485 RepID=UPI0004A01253|nr:type IV secretory system conjugative DNA transfer family protein [Neisseria gonorrhoeae]ARC00108.1 conjugal transfer protein TraG [Neisseria gonorrhoeae]KDM98490.1 conjugal transfer protein TraG [Neisseria gonorrhoeae]KDN01190.1 conjugal transfer protein TraG [Neisseria gonorrhoeae]KLS30603.1 conjugal transfer protein TraG [Neisseria gonorrhoeae ALB_2011_03_03]KLS39613.1 conjugal transfer protein TraG [Neisseria gonorrhoeae ATL_2011_01_05]